MHELVNQSIKITFLKLIFLLILTVWISGLIYPSINAFNNSLHNFILSKIYSSVCHQVSDKCFSLNGIKFMVCARCSGIYFGAFGSALASLFLSTPTINLKLLICSAILILLDVLFTSAGLYKYSTSIAFSTGVFFGVVIYLIIVKELENIFRNKSIYIG